eukprot:Skav203991  [mRNA]  locus=scaffold3297:93196:99199:+ [translate_table: standard]
MGAAGAKTPKVSPEFDNVSPAITLADANQKWQHLDPSSSWVPKPYYKPLALASVHVPAPTDREDHERHVRRMNRYLLELQRKPRKFRNAEKMEGYASQKQLSARRTDTDAALSISRQQSQATEKGADKTVKLSQSSFMKRLRLRMRSGK